MENNDGQPPVERENPFKHLIEQHMPFDVGSYSCSLNEKKWFGKIEMHVSETGSTGMYVDKLKIDAVSRRGEREYVGCVLDGSFEYRSVSKSGVSSVKGEDNLEIVTYLLGENGIDIKKYFSKATKALKEAKDKNQG